MIENRKIELDEEKKLVLLQALKDGYIDSHTLNEWIGNRPMTLEEARRMMKELEDDCMIQQGGKHHE